MSRIVKLVEITSKIYVQTWNRKQDYNGGGGEGVDPKQTNGSPQKKYFVSLSP